MTHEKDPTLIRGEDFLVKGEYRSFTFPIKSAEFVERKSERGCVRGLLIYFEGAKKPLFCPEDKTNFRMIRTEIGTVEPAEMVGKKLTMIPVKGDWYGAKNALAVRVIVTGDKPKPNITSKAFGTPVTGLKVS